MQPEGTQRLISIRLKSAENHFARAARQFRVAPFAIRAPRVCQPVRPPAERAPSRVGRFAFSAESSTRRQLVEALCPLFGQRVALDGIAVREPRRDPRSRNISRGNLCLCPRQCSGTRAAAPRISMALQKGRHFLVARPRASRRRSILAATRRREPRNHTIHQAKDRHKTQTPRKRGPHRHKARQDHYALTV